MVSVYLNSLWLFSTFLLVLNWSFVIYKAYKLENETPDFNTIHFGYLCIIFLLTFVTLPFFNEKSKKNSFISVQIAEEKTRELRSTSKDINNIINAIPQPVIVMSREDRKILF